MPTPLAIVDYHTPHIVFRRFQSFVPGRGEKVHLAGCGSGFVGSKEWELTSDADVVHIWLVDWTSEPNPQQTPSET